MLNDIEMLKRLARRHDLKLCLDCVSAIGAIPLDLRGVYLATGASGKALAAFPGLSVVFHNHHVNAEPTRVPRYLDLGYYVEKDGIAFTHSSNLVGALDVALNRFETSEPFERIVELSAWLRPRLRDLGFNILVPDADATAADGQNVTPRHLDPDVRQRDSESQIRCHRALAGEQALEQRLRF